MLLLLFAFVKVKRGAQRQQNVLRKRTGDGESSLLTLRVSALRSGSWLTPWHKVSGHHQQGRWICHGDLLGVLAAAGTPRAASHGVQLFTPGLFSPKSTVAAFTT